MCSIKQAFRQLTLRAGLSLVVIAMLAVGIGGTTAIFALYYFVELKPLPVADPRTLVNLRAPGERPGNGRPSVTIDDQEAAFSYAMFRDLEADDAAFSGLAAHYDFLAQITTGTQRSGGRGLLVSGRYFEVLSLSPAVGRLIESEDTARIGDGDVVVLSYDYWQSRFGGDPDVVGELITVNNRALTIVGVAPAEFSGSITGWRPQVYVPLTLRWAMQPEMPRDYDDRQARWLYLFARLRPGLDAAQAADLVNRRYAAVLAEIEAPLLAGVSESERERFLSGRIVLVPGGRGQNPPAAAADPALLMLAAMVLVLVIVCINVANLLLARGATREQELAVRAAVGASRRALVVQLLLESTLLALIGGLLSVPVAFAGMAFIEGVLIPPNLAELVDLDISPAAIVFASAVTIATVLLCGVVPALKTSRADPGRIIKAHAASSLGARARGRLRGGLLPVQIALAVALLVLAGLFMGSLINVSRVELGMDVEPVVTFSVAPLIAGYDAGRVDRLYDEITRRLEREPGIRSVASTVIPPLSGFVLPANIADRALEIGGEARFTQGVPLTSPRVFETLSIPFVAGRDFTASDIQPTPVVSIVNEAFVRAHDLGEEPVGTFVRVAGPLVQSTVEVIGVVRDAHYSSIKGPVLPQLFTPRVPADVAFPLRFFYVKADVDPDGLVTRIPRIVAEIDPSVPVGNLATFARRARDNSWGDRLLASLTTSFAMLATLLTAVGLYGVLSYNLARRTREFGLRIALGAKPSRLLIGVLKQVATTALIGLGSGLALGVVLGALAAGMLYGFAGDDDAVVLVGAVLVIAIVVTGASYFPALRASRIEPMQALRYD